MKWIRISGNFSPISNRQLQELRTLHRKNPDACLLLSAPLDHFFEELLLELIEKMPYCWVSTQKITNPDYDLHNSDETLSLKNLYRFPLIVARAIYATPVRLEELLKEMLSDWRYQHSSSVAAVAQELAITHGVNVYQAYLAGILHDCLKEFSEEENDAWLRYYDPARLTAPKAIKHAYAAKYFLRHAACLQDKDILNAIYHHSDGLSNAKLAMILYIADKRDPLRGINDNYLDLARKDLSASFELLKIDVKEYIKERNSGK